MGLDSSMNYCSNFLCVRHCVFISVTVLALCGLIYSGIYLGQVDQNFLLRYVPRILGNMTAAGTNDKDAVSLMSKETPIQVGFHGNTSASNITRGSDVISFLPARASLYTSFNRELPIYASNQTSNKTKTIVFWSKWYGQQVWWNMKDNMGRKPFQNRLCFHKNCVLTTDKSKLKEADLLLFYFGDKPNFPPVRYPHQYYAHFVHESPGGKPGKRTFADVYQGKINLTLNYRFDSDMYCPYNMILKKTDATDGMKYTARYPFSKKTKSVVWPVSHCKAKSHRDEYAKELSKYIDVDIFGGCGKHRCPRSRGKACLGEWEQSYKFYLAFENNICQDYITEKMYQPLGRELVPIVLGGGNYTRDAPPHSVINVRDYSSPQELAKYLNYLSTHEEEYNKYFQWKPYYDIVPVTTWSLCRLCDVLHEGSIGKSVAAQSYRNWWFGENGEVCDNQMVNKMRARGGW